MKKYSKKQITEAIKYWEKQFNDLNESNQSEEDMIKEFLNGIFQQEFGNTITIHLEHLSDLDYATKIYNIYFDGDFDKLNVEIRCALYSNKKFYCEIFINSGGSIFGLDDSSTRNPTDLKKHQLLFKLISFIYENYKKIESGLIEIFNL